MCCSNLNGWGGFAAWANNNREATNKVKYKDALYDALQIQEDKYCCQARRLKCSCCSHAYIFLQNPHNNSTIYCRAGPRRQRSLQPEWMMTFRRGGGGCDILSTAEDRICTWRGPSAQRKSQKVMGRPGAGSAVGRTGPPSSPGGAADRRKAEENPTGGLKSVPREMSHSSAFTQQNGWLGWSSMLPHDWTRNVTAPSLFHRLVCTRLQGFSAWAADTFDLVGLALKLFFSQTVPDTARPIYCIHGAAALGQVKTR